MPFGGHGPPYNDYSHRAIQGPPKVWGAGVTIPKAPGGHAHPATVQHAHDSDLDCPRFGPLQKKQKVPFFYPWNRKPLGIGRLKHFLQMD